MPYYIPHQPPLPRPVPPTLAWILNPPPYMPIAEYLDTYYPLVNGPSTRAPSSSIYFVTAAPPPPSKRPRPLTLLDPNTLSYHQNNRSKMPKVSTKDAKPVSSGKAAPAKRGKKEKDPNKPKRYVIFPPCAFTSSLLNLPAILHCSFCPLHKLCLS